MFDPIIVGIHTDLSPVKRRRGKAVPIDAKPSPAELVLKFLSQCTFDVDGGMIPFGEFRKRFKAWSPAELSDYQINRALPPRHASGAGNGNKTFIVNASWTSDAPSTPLAVHKGRIQKVAPCKTS